MIACFSQYKEPSLQYGDWYEQTQYSAINLKIFFILCARHFLHRGLSFAYLYVRQNNTQVQRCVVILYFISSVPCHAKAERAGKCSWCKMHVSGRDMNMNSIIKLGAKAQKVRWWHLSAYEFTFLMWAIPRVSPSSARPTIPDFGPHQFRWMPTIRKM